jgi:hypothetical protein
MVASGAACVVEVTDRAMTRGHPGMDHSVCFRL